MKAKLLVPVAETTTYKLAPSLYRPLAVSFWMPKGVNLCVAFSLTQKVVALSYVSELRRSKRALALWNAAAQSAT